MRTWLLAGEEDGVLEDSLCWPALVQESCLVGADLLHRMAGVAVVLSHVYLRDHLPRLLAEEDTHDQEAGLVSLAARQCRP